MTGDFLACLLSAATFTCDLQWLRSHVTRSTGSERVESAIARMISGTGSQAAAASARVSHVLEGKFNSRAMCNMSNVTRHSHLLYYSHLLHYSVMGWLQSAASAAAADHIKFRIGGPRCSYRALCTVINIINNRIRSSGVSSMGGRFCSRCVSCDLFKWALCASGLRYRL